MELSDLDENEVVLLRCCTYMCLTLGLEIKVSDLFIRIISDENLLKFFRNSLYINTNFELLKFMTEIMPEMNKNKVITSYVSRNLKKR